MGPPPLSYDDGLKHQLEEAGVRLDADSIKFWIQFTGGHRGIFMAGYALGAAEAAIWCSLGSVGDDQDGARKLWDRLLELWKG